MVGFLCVCQCEPVTYSVSHIFNVLLTGTDLLIALIFFIPVIDMNTLLHCCVLSCWDLQKYSHLIEMCVSLRCAGSPQREANLSVWKWAYLLYGMGWWGDQSFPCVCVFCVCVAVLTSQLIALPQAMMNEQVLWDTWPHTQLEHKSVCRRMNWMRMLHLFVWVLLLHVCVDFYVCKCVFIS